MTSFALNSVAIKALSNYDHAMLRFMAICLITAFTLLLSGAVEAALLVGLLFVATPFAYIGWHLFFARYEYN